MLNSTVIGNLGNEPVMRTLANGQTVCNFDIASNRVYNDSEGQQVKETTWFTVAVWGPQAANCAQYLHQGSLVSVIFSRFAIDPETGGPRVFARNDGSAGAKYEIVADRVNFLDSVATRQARQATATPQAAPVAAPARPRFQTVRPTVAHQPEPDNGSADDIVF